MQFPLLRTIATPRGDDAARPARPARPHALLPRLPRRAAGLDLRRPARADAAGATGSAPIHHGLPRDLYRFSPRPHRTAISPSSAASRRRSAPTAPSRSPRRAGLPLKIAAKVDNADLAYWQDGDRAAGRAPTRWSSSSARSASARRPRSSATPRRCSSRSTGPSRSAW